MMPFERESCSIVTFVIVNAYGMMPFARELCYLYVHDCECNRLTTVVCFKYNDAVHSCCHTTLRTHPLHTHTHTHTHTHERACAQIQRARVCVTICILFQRLCIKTLKPRLPTAQSMRSLEMCTLVIALSTPQLQRTCAYL